jgi:hypothetical protein
MVFLSGFERFYGVFGCFYGVLGCFWGLVAGGSGCGTAVSVGDLEPFKDFLWC